MLLRILLELMYLINCPLFLGRHAFPFIDEEEEQVTQRARGRRGKERKAFRTARSFFSFVRVPPTLQMVTGMAPRRFVADATPWRCRRVVTSQSVPAGDAANQRAGQRPYRE